jgi:hypothetical protein
MIKVGAVLKLIHLKIIQLLVVYWHLSDEAIETDKPHDQSNKVLQKCHFSHFRFLTDY